MTHPRSALRRLTLVLAVLGLFSTLLTACGNDGDNSQAVVDDDTGHPESSDAEGEAVEEDSSFPVTVTAGNGEVTIDERPERIISLSASLTEMLFAVGAGDQVVAVDQYSNHPPEAPTTDLSGFSPNAEAIVGYEPDLVVVASDRDGIVEALEGAGLTVLLLSSADSVDHAFDQLGAIAAATGHADAGDALVADLRAELDALAATGEEADPVTYYYELSDTYHSATSDTFIGSLLALAGFESIADEVGDDAGRFPQLSAEFILGADPDVILVAGTGSSGAGPDEIAARPGWDQLSAVAEGRVVSLDEDLASRWGPRMVDLLAEVVAAVEETGLR